MIGIRVTFWTGHIFIFQRFGQLVEDMRARRSGIDAADKYELVGYDPIDMTVKHVFFEFTDKQKLGEFLGLSNISDDTLRELDSYDDIVNPPSIQDRPDSWSRE